MYIFLKIVAVYRAHSILSWSGESICLIIYDERGDFDPQLRICQVDQRLKPIYNYI